MARWRKNIVYIEYIHLHLYSGNFDFMSANCCNGKVIIYLLMKIPMLSLVSQFWKEIETKSMTERFWVLKYDSTLNFTTNIQKNIIRELSQDAFLGWVSCSSTKIVISSHFGRTRAFEDEKFIPYKLSTRNFCSENNWKPQKSDHFSYSFALHKYLFIYLFFY